MIFSKPVPFSEAVDSREVRSILPTTADTQQLSAIAPALRERAVFSAKVTNYRFLEFIDESVGRILSPELAAPGEALDPALFRVQARELLDALSYQPEPGKEGTLSDLRSTVRLDVIIDTNTKMAHGYGEYQQGQSESILDMWPAQELYRMESRDQERDWSSRWQSAGGSIFNGRMIALKDSSVWSAISAFGLPYPPFDFNSGMGVRDIDRAEAESLGLIDRNKQVAPDSRDFNDDLEMSAPDRESNLFASLLQSLGTSAEITGGVLKFV